LFSTHGATLVTAKAVSGLGSNTYRVPTLLVTKKSRTFQDPRSIFPGTSHKPATSKYRQTVVTNHTYGMIAAYILEYMFITITRCKEIAKKRFKHFLWT